MKTEFKSRENFQGTFEPFSVIFSSPLIKLYIRFDTNITKLLPFPLILCNTISVVENAHDRNARRDGHFDECTENVTESLPGTHGGMQRDAEHTGEAENKWGPLGGTKEIYVRNIQESRKEIVEGTPHLTDEQSNGRIQSGYTGPLDEVFLWPSFFFPQVPGWRVNWSWIFFSFLSVLGFFFLGLGRSHRAKFPLGFFSPLVLVTFIE